MSCLGKKKWCETNFNDNEQALANQEKEKIKKNTLKRRRDEIALEYSALPTSSFFENVCMSAIDEYGRYLKGKRKNLFTLWHTNGKCLSLSCSLALALFIKF